MNVTGVLATSGGSAPPATAPLKTVAAPTEPDMIPLNAPFALALLLLGAVGGMHLRRRKI